METIYYNFKVTYQESLNQEGLFTNNHKKYNVKIEYKNESLYCTYQCNPNYNAPSKKDILQCVLMDASAFNYSQNIADFANEYGYTKISECLEVFEACKGAYNYINNTIGADKIGELIDYIETL